MAQDAEAPIETITLFTGDRTKLELGTITEEERKGATHTYPALSTKVLDSKGATYLFLCNSHPEKTLEVTTRLPEKCTVLKLPDEEILEPEGTAQIKTHLSPYAVAMYRISP